MKATVMESKNGTSVILTEDGVFHKVIGTYEVGSEIRYGTPIRRKRAASRIAAIAACLLMALSMGTYSYQNLMVYATVTLEGTAPIQLELNRHDKVINVKAMAKEGEELAERLLDSGIKGEHVRTALDRAEQIIACVSDSDKIAILPHVQCKSSDKVKALTDMISHRDDPDRPAADTKPSVTSDPGDAAGAADKPAADKPGDKPSDSSSEAATAPETGTEADPAPGCGEDPSTEDMSSQDEETQDADQGEEPGSQAETESVNAHEAYEQSAPSAPAGESSAPASNKPAPADTPDDMMAE